MDLEQTTNKLVEVMMDQFIGEDATVLLKALDFFVVPTSLFRYAVYPILDAFKDDPDYATVELAVYTTCGFIEGIRAVGYAYVISKLF